MEKFHHRFKAVEEVINDFKGEITANFARISRIQNLELEVSTKVDHDEYTSTVEETKALRKKVLSLDQDNFVLRAQLKRAEEVTKNLEHALDRRLDNLECLID